MSQSQKPTRRPDKGRGLFYTRDSSDRSEMAPGGYLNWAAKKAKEFGVSFTGTPAHRLRQGKLVFRVPARKGTR